MSKASYKSKKGESSSQYRQCVPPCPRFITSGDTHSLCVVCLGVKHAESALEGAGYPHCERLPLRTLRSRRTLFEEGVFASAPLRLQGIRILNYIDDWLILAHSEQMAVRHRDVVLPQMKSWG